MTTPCPDHGPGYVTRDNNGLPHCCLSGGMYAYRNPMTNPMCYPIPGESKTPPRPATPAYRDMLPRIMSDVTQANGRPGFALTVDAKGGRWACPDMFTRQGASSSEYGMCVQLQDKDSPIAAVVSRDPRFSNFRNISNIR
jgi:hypothetical protein